MRTRTLALSLAPARLRALGAVFTALFALSSSACLCRTGSACDMPAGDGGHDANAAAQAIFDRACVGCHSGSVPQGGLDLSANGLLGRVVNQHSTQCSTTTKVLVAPGDPDHSFLIETVADPMPTCAIRMPQIGGPLSETDIATLRDWITQLGASPDAGM
jgi:hypothetical protein